MNKLYESALIKGSYLNQMLHCGSDANFWIEHALTEILPEEIFNEHKENLAFISTSTSDAFRVARELCENRELIVLSERISELKGKNQGSKQVRYFIFVVLHEIAHAICKHKSPMFDGINQMEIENQENEANDLAYSWYNDYVKQVDNSSLPQLTKAEVAAIQSENQQLMQT